MDAGNLIVNAQPKVKVTAKPNNTINNVADKKPSKNDGGTSKQDESFGAVFDQVVNPVVEDKEDVSPEASDALALLPGNNQAAVLLQLTAAAQLANAVATPNAIGMTDAAQLTNQNIKMADAAILANLNAETTDTADTAILAAPKETVAKAADSLVSALQNNANTAATEVTAANKGTFADALLSKQAPAAAAPVVAPPANSTAETTMSDSVKSLIGANNTTTQVNPETSAKAMLNALGSGSATVMANANQASSVALNKSDSTVITPQVTANQLSDVTTVLRTDNKNAGNNSASSDGQNTPNQLLNQQPEQTVRRNEPVAAFSQQMTPTLGESSGESASAPVNVNIEAPLPQTENKSAATNQQQFLNSVMDVRSNAVNTSSATNPTAAPTQDYQIPQQIVEQAKLIKTTEDTQMIIKLKPEHLGELSMKISVEKGVVSASFHSDNAQVRAMLETSLVQLKQELAAQGIKVDNVGVYSGMGDLLSNGQQHTGREQQNPRYKNRQIDMSEFGDEVDKLAPVMANVASDEGVDYRI